MFDILEERGIEYHKIGNLHRCFCPFHSDTDTPNLFIYADTNSWYCYACNIGGSPVDFILEYDECTLKEALKRASVRDPGVRVRLKKQKDKLEDKDFTDQVNLRVSKLFPQAFKKLPAELVLKFMKKLDKRLKEENISFDEAKRMVNAFKEKFK